MPADVVSGETICRACAGGIKGLAESVLLRAEAGGTPSWPATIAGILVAPGQSGEAWFFNPRPEVDPIPLSLGFHRLCLWAGFRAEP